MCMRRGVPACPVNYADRFTSQTQSKSFAPRQVILSTSKYPLFHVVLFCISLPLDVSTLLNLQAKDVQVRIIMQTKNDLNSIYTQTL